MPIHIGEMTTDVTVEDAPSSRAAAGHNQDHGDDPTQAAACGQTTLRDSRRTAAEDYDD